MKGAPFAPPPGEGQGGGSTARPPCSGAPAAASRPFFGLEGENWHGET